MLSTGEKTNPGPLGKTFTFTLLVIFVLISKSRGNSESGSSYPIRCHVRQGQVPEWGPY
jgi:hypothetical protein